MQDYERTAFEHCAQLTKRYRRQVKTQRIIIAVLILAVAAEALIER